MRKALVVGLNQYPKHNLSWCSNDAESIAGLLEKNEDESRNFDVLKIVDSCDAGSLRNAIQRLFSDTTEIALLFFAGHGADQDGGYLVTSDFTSSNLGVRMTDVLTWANESKSTNKVIILDCCFSGKMGESLLLRDNTVLGNGVTIIASSLPMQESQENIQKRHGVFTDLLVQGLNGGAADIRGNITPASLYSYVDQSLGAWEQRPVFKTNISRFLPIRTTNAKVPQDKLRKLSQYFKSPSELFQLDPSYEDTNDPSVIHEYIEPYADKAHIAVLKDLQLFASVGLVEPVDTDHMYFAAMESKSCRLTALGQHYWRLSKDTRF